MKIMIPGIVILPSKIVQYIATVIIFIIAGYDILLISTVYFSGRKKSRMFRRTRYITGYTWAAVIITVALAVQMNAV